MPSSKRIRGKARKAARAEAKETQRQNSVSSSSSRIPILFDNETECFHGLQPSDLREDSFLVLSPALRAIKHYDEMSDQPSAVVAFSAAQTTLLENNPSFFEDAAAIEVASKQLLCMGTNVLTGNVKGPPLCANPLFFCAALMALFESLCQHAKVKMHCSQPFNYRHKIYDLLYSDKRRLVSYIRKRIPCSCLDKTFSALKHFPKMSVCDNINSCGRVKIEADALLSCERCRKAHYCSRECQAAAFHDHKHECIGWKEWSEEGV